MRASSRDISARPRLVLFIVAVCAASTLSFMAWRYEGPLSQLVIPFQGGLQDAEALEVATAGSAAWGHNYTSAIQLLYQPRGYTVCKLSDATIPCWLQLATQVDCATLFDDYVKTLKTHVPVFPTPKELPSHLRDEFLLHDFTQLSSLYVPQPDYDLKATVPIWTQDTIQEFMQKAKAGVAVGSYGEGSLPIYKALSCHPIRGLTGAVFGTDIPWVEGFLFALGAAHLSTIEFRTTISHIPNHKIIKPLEWVQDFRSGALPSVDFAFSFSSWEHDGLGRYGDPIDPWGDVKAMQRTSCYVKPGGLLYFAAPSSGIDQIMYNAHRIYGPVRLPLLTANWHVLGVFDAKFRADECGSATCEDLFGRWRQTAPRGMYMLQPVIVLRNMRTAPCSVVGAGARTGA